MKSFINFLKRNRIYTAINLIGLTISMTFVLILAAYVRKQLSTDAFQENGDRIMIIANDWYGSAYHLKDHMRDRYPEIENYCAFLHEANIEAKVDGNTVYADYNYADSSFFDIFSFRIIEGDVQEFKNSENNLIVSESFARRMFPDESAIGHHIYDCTIVAVMEDIDNSVIPYCDILIRGEWMEKNNPAHNMDLGNSGDVQTFVLVKENCDLMSRRDDMLEYFKEIWWTYKGGVSTELRLIPLRDIYFYDVEKIPQLLKGDKSVVSMLAMVCIVLLIFTIFNYVNMTTALSGFRAMEMASKQLLGASRARLFLKLMSESTLLCFIATAAAFFIAEGLSPTASRLLEYDFSIFEAATFDNIAIIIAFIVLLGIISGLVPAFVLLRVRPIDIVRGSWKARTKTVGSRIIIVLQAVTTMCMLIAAITMNRQINHMLEAPLGYTTENVINIKNQFGMPQQLNVAKEKLLDLPCVVNVGYGQGTPLYGSNNNTMPIQGVGYVSFQQFMGDQGYFDILGIREKQDNNAPYTYWFNEYAFKELGIDEDTQTILAGNEEWESEMPVGGVYYDFKVRPLLENQSSAMIFNYRDKWPDQLYPWNILVQVNSDRTEAMNAVKSVFAEVFPEVLFEGKYISDEVADTFRREMKIRDIIILFTIISIFVSMLGLFAMSIYYMSHEKKNVALKIIMGADRRGVLAGLVGSFMKMIVAAAVISIPIGWYVMERWLDGFSYRIQMYWWIPAAAALVTILTSFLTVLWQSIRTADTNPIETLKNE